MNTKSLFAIAAALTIAAQSHASVGFGFNFGVPLYYPAPVYRTVAVYQGQPGQAAEQITAAPGPGYVWIAGHWSNRNGQWVWLSGRWEMPPSPSSAWVDGHWSQSHGGWVWIDGGWATNTPPVPPSTPPGPDLAPQAPAAPATAAPAPNPPPPAGPAPAQASVALPSTPPPPAPDLAEGTEVEQAPPPPIVEYVAPCPDPGLVWIDGYWGWHGGWYWVAGHYGRPPFRGAAWVRGVWSRGSHGWAWHGGHWR